MTNKKVKEEETLLSEQDVWNVLTYADSLMGGGGIYQSVLNPMLLNQRLKDITMNPLQASETALANAMASPKSSEVELLGFSEGFELQSQVYKRLLSYLGNMLDFGLSYSSNAKSTDYKSPAYNKDLDEVKKFFDRFDYKQEFSTAVKQMLRSEAVFYCPRFDMDRIVLQELPSSPIYSMITGRWDYGLSFSFNLYWFALSGISIDMYPDFFKEKVNEFWQNSGGQKYDPALPSVLRGSSSYVFWQDIPGNVGWCWKLSPEIATRIPYFAPLFLDLVQQPVMRALQKNINLSVASRTLIGQIGTLKDTGAKLKDQFNINPDLLGKFLSLVKSAVGESLKVAAAPLDNLQGISFPAENEVYDSYLRTALASSGINSNLIFTNSLRPNSLESQLSTNTDESLMFSLYPQFESFLNFHVNRLTKKFKFNFEFEGSQFFNNREQRLATQQALMAQGIVLPHKISAAIGMNPFSFQRQMEEAKAMGWVDQLTPIVPAFQQGADTGAGRPKKKDGDLGDSGDQTRSDGANIGRGGKV